MGGLDRAQPLAPGPPSATSSSRRRSRRSCPALGNYLVALFKETPLLSAIAVLELMQTAKIIGSQTFRYTEPITLVGAFFLVMSLVSAAGIRALERHLNRRPTR